MTVQELKEKLDQITDECGDFNVFIDTGDINLMELESVKLGDAWYIILSPEEEGEDNI